jgi:hypothetical protein
MVVTIIVMVRTSQRPYIAKIIAIDPLIVDGVKYLSLDDALTAMGRDVSPEEVSVALRKAGLPVSITTLYRWKKNEQV